MRTARDLPPTSRCDALDRDGVDVPLIGDFHFNGHRLLTDYPDCAEALAKYRINPGNVGRGAKRDEQFATMIETACRHEKPVRIGVNWGSLDQEHTAGCPVLKARSILIPLDRYRIIK